MPHPTNPTIRCDRCKAFEPDTTVRDGLCRREPIVISVCADNWCRKFEAITPPPPAPPPGGRDLARAAETLVNCRAALAASQPYTHLLPPEIEQRLTACFWDADALLRDLFPYDDMEAPDAKA